MEKGLVLNGNEEPTTPTGQEADRLPDSVRAAIAVATAKASLGGELIRDFASN